MKTICKKTRKCFPALALMLAVAGCATSPAPVYYTLAPPAAGNTANRSNVAAEIGPFELPDYLDRPQIVTAGPGATLRLDEFHRWVEPLDEIFVRSLAARVRMQVGSDAILAAAAHHRFDAPYRVLGSVQRFETNSDGQAVLDVQWTIVDRDGKPAKPGIRSHYATRTGDPADVDARVRALGDALELFAADIADALQAQPRP